MLRPAAPHSHARGGPSRSRSSSVNAAKPRNAVKMCENSSVESASAIVPRPSVTAVAAPKPGLQALRGAPHEHQQQQAGQHVAPQPDQVDQLVVAGLRRGVARPLLGVHPAQDGVPGQHEQREAGSARRVPVSVIADLVARVRLVGVDRGLFVVERLQQVVVGGLVPGEVLDQGRVGEAHEQDRREREAPVPTSRCLLGRDRRTGYASRMRRCGGAGRARLSVPEGGSAQHS